MFEWNEASLCIPRRCFGTAASITGNDLSYVELGRVDAVDAVNRLAPIVAMWNKDRVYDNRTANPQNFIDALCEALSLNFNSLRGPIGMFISQILSLSFDLLIVLMEWKIVANIFSDA